MIKFIKEWDLVSWCVFVVFVALIQSHWSESFELAFILMSFISIALSFLVQAIVKFINEGLGKDDNIH